MVNFVFSETPYNPNNMKIAIVGTGYVGLVSGACFAEMGVEVTCVDINPQKIASLKRGEIPIYEPGLEEMVLRNHREGRLNFTTKLTECINDVEAVFCAVGTPPDEDGSADLSYVLAVAHEVGANMDHYLVVVTKSTVPVGTSHKVKAAIQEELQKRGKDIPFDVASNPEFLKEGAAVKDFMSPDRVVVGVESQRARDLMTRLYSPFMLNNFRVIFTDIPSAEMIKYAANSMLATRISFMNDIANLCELVGADVNMVRKGIGSDSRIGSKFLYPGCGYGGSCFPKDVKALIKTAEQNGYSMRVLKAVEEVNEQQKSVLFRKLNQYYAGDLKGKTIAVWFGLQSRDRRYARGHFPRDHPASFGSRLPCARLRPHRHEGMPPTHGRQCHLCQGYVRRRAECRCHAASDRMEAVPPTILGSRSPLHAPSRHFRRP